MPIVRPVATLLASIAVTLLTITGPAIGQADEAPEDLGRTDNADGLERTVRVWAAPGLTRSPVAFTMSPDGRVWVAESDRAGNAVSDTRQLGHLDPVWNDGQLRSVADRRALIDRWVAGGHFDADYFTRTEDRVRVVTDTDGDGVADDARVFAGGFNDAVDGIGSGVLWVDDALLYTNIPHLWSLTDRDGDGTVDEDPAAGERTSLVSGFGIRWCFYGHDLHGLVAGPDGRIWFTMGDRGYRATTTEGQALVGTDRGGVFRCWPDGTGLELVHEGLRNPQELIFDVLGNAFTGDNNCDSGDRARVTLVLEGADSGWRQDVQSLPSRGPWNREFMWNLAPSASELVDPVRPAWMLPPIAHVGAGPSGFALQPGTGESGHADGAMMLVDFYGSGARIHAFHMEPRGAWFSLRDQRTWYQGATVTDIAWGADGRLYMTDWGGGWSPNPNGRVLTVTNESVHADPDGQAAIAFVQDFLASDVSARSTDALLAALDHADRRVRHAAQIEIARRGGWRPTAATHAEATDVPPTMRERIISRLDATAADGVDLGSVHAVWALGQIARRDIAARDAIVARLAHANLATRVQLLRVAADLRLPASSIYIAALADPDPAVNAAAALALGRSGVDAESTDAAADALLALHRQRGDDDPVVRHQVWLALARSMSPEDLADRLATDASGTADRLALVLALRRQAIIRVGEDVPVDGPRARARAVAADALAARLDDPSVRVAAEVVRAIYDLHLGAPEPFTPGGPASRTSGPDARATAFAALAASLDGINPARAIEPIVRRTIEANLRLGAAGVDPVAPARILRFAARDDLPAAWRILALERLETWAGGDRRERVWGHWIPRVGRDIGPVESALAAAESALVAAAAGDTELRFRVDRIRARLLLTMTVAEIRDTLADSQQDARFRAVLLEEAVRRNPGAAIELCTIALDQDEPAADVLRIAALDVLASGDRDPERLLAAARTCLERGTDPERQHAAAHLGRLAAAVDGPAAEPAAAELIARMPNPSADDDPVIALELYRAASAVPSGTTLHAAAIAIDARWTGRRPAGFADALLRAGGDPAQGAAIFRHHEVAQCLRCHTVHGVGGNAGPELTAVGARLSTEALIESIVEPGRTIVPGYGTVAAMPVITDVLSPEEVRHVVAYLVNLDDPRTIRPVAVQTRASRFLAGTAYHLAGVLLAVVIAAITLVIGRRGH